MRQLRGIPVVDGVVIAEAMVLEAEKYRLPGTQRFERMTEVDVEAQIVRYAKAVEIARDQLERKRLDLEQDPRAPAVAVAIISVHSQFLDDQTFHDKVAALIRELSLSPEQALSRQVNSYRKIFSATKNMVRLVGDLDDFEQILLSHLLGEERETLKDLTSEVIVIARDLTPQQTMDLPREWVKGFATDQGGKTSHTAILAQSMGVPAVVGLGRVTDIVTGGELVILDGRNGRVIVDPDEATLARYRKRRAKFEALQSDLEELKALPGETLDGYRIRLFANIGSPDEIEQAIHSGAEGIGLYRTEFLYSSDNPDPTEEDHYTAYARAIELLDERPLVIRTIDLGADKFVPDSIKAEANPFLGCRSIRYCLLEREDVFLRQLRAILRASARGDVRLMLPMISSLEELKRAKELIEDAKSELDADGLPYRRDIPIGIMIEVPSAALVADILAQHSDFFSIGTNDLVQYVLAVDRVNEKVQELYQPAHPAVFRLLLQTIEAARRHKIPVSICGELSGEPEFTLPLLGLGLRDLSMAPSLIPKIKRFIRSITASEAGRTVDEVLTQQSASQTSSFLIQRARDLDPEFFD